MELLVRQNKQQREAGSPHAATREELRRQAKRLAKEQRVKEQRRDSGRLEHVRHRREKGLKAREAAFAEARAKSKERAVQEMLRRARRESEAKANQGPRRPLRLRESSEEEERRAVQALLSVQNTPVQSSDDEPRGRGARLPFKGSPAGPVYSDSGESDGAGAAPAGPTREQLVAKAILDESTKKVRSKAASCGVWPL